MTTSALNYCYIASDLFVVKTDAYLFLLKNLYYFNSKLEKFNIEIKIGEVKEEQNQGGGLINLIR